MRSLVMLSFGPNRLSTKSYFIKEQKYEQLLKLLNAITDIFFFFFFCTLFVSFKAQKSIVFGILSQLLISKQS
jgi:hypothetical protein